MNSGVKTKNRIKNLVKQNTYPEVTSNSDETNLYNEKQTWPETLFAQTLHAFVAAHYTRPVRRYYQPQLPKN